MFKTTDAQRRASSKWQKNNRTKACLYSKKYRETHKEIIKTKRSLKKNNPLSTINIIGFL